MSCLLRLVHCWLPRGMRCTLPAGALLLDQAAGPQPQIQCCGAAPLLPCPCSGFVTLCRDADLNACEPPAGDYPDSLLQAEKLLGQLAFSLARLLEAATNNAQLLVGGEAALLFCCMPTACGGG